MQAALDLKEEILALKKERNAVILAHNYQTGDIQDLSAFTRGYVGRHTADPSALDRNIHQAIHLVPGIDDVSALDHQLIAGLAPGCTGQATQKQNSRN